MPTKVTVETSENNVYVTRTTKKYDSSHDEHIEFKDDEFILTPGVSKTFIVTEDVSLVIEEYPVKVVLPDHSHAFLTPL